MENKFKNLKSCIKRCESMGVHHAFENEFNNHKLAPVFNNYLDMIYDFNETKLNIELSRSIEEYIEILYYLDIIAKNINLFCDNNLIKNDKAAQYFMELFLRHCNIVSFINKS